MRSRIKGWLRRQREAHFPDLQTRVYRRWIAARLQVRISKPQVAIEPGLLSILTAVWNGTPAAYLEQLAICIAAQNRQGHVEWVICDNGCREPELVHLLHRLQEQTWIKVRTQDTNLGIVQGLRLCLETADTRYVLPVDADDLLYPDTLTVVAKEVNEHQFPALLYSDEDKIVASKASQPYFKPDFDPVLLSNSAYIAHLGVIDRLKALALGAYTNPATEGSVDWDLFLRFVNAGHVPIHIRAILYRWRIHSSSTADDPASKTYIGSSQSAALQGFLSRHPCGENFSVVESPFLPGGAHFRLLRSSRSIATHRMEFWQNIPQFPSLSGLPGWLQRLPHETQFVLLIDRDLKFDASLLEAEVGGIFELFSDTACVGGRLLDERGIIVDADRHFGFAGTCGSPLIGVAATHPGYFGQAFKQRSVSAVPSQLIAVDVAFLRDALANLPETASPLLFGCWLGAIARCQGRRVVYSPYLSAITSDSWSRRANSAELSTLAERYAQIVPDRRYYPWPLSLTHAYRIDQ